MTSDEREPPSDRASELAALRIVREYRRLVLMGRLRLPLAQARKLVGPDCAFHLYSRDGVSGPRRGRRRRSKARAAARS
jgi:hypothetical protein